MECILDSCRRVLVLTCGGRKPFLLPKVSWAARWQALPRPDMGTKKCRFQHRSHNASKVFNVGKFFRGPSTKEPASLLHHVRVQAGLSGEIAVVESSGEQPQTINRPTKRILFGGIEDSPVGVIVIPLLPWVDILPVFRRVRNGKNASEQGVRDRGLSYFVCRLRVVDRQQLYNVEYRARVIFDDGKEDRESLRR